MAKIVNSNEFSNEVLNNSGVVLVDFFAKWCGPCKMIAPSIEELSSEMSGKAKVIKIDVDKNPDIAQKYGIMNIPTIMIFKAGKEVDKIVGFQPKHILKGKLEYFLN